MRGRLNRRYCQLSLIHVTQDSSCLNMGAELKMAKEFTPMQRQNSTLKVIARIYKNIQLFFEESLLTDKECQKEVRVLTTWKYFK